MAQHRRDSADASLIDVDVFESPALPRRWHRLDAFEGPGYRRVAVHVATCPRE
jgi:hypothetical protein